MAAAVSNGPRVRVAALIVRDGLVVLVRHHYRGATYHLLPGGGVEHGETLAAALVREVREETGLEVETGSLLFVNDTIDPHSARHIVNITFVATQVGGRICETPDDHRVEAVDLVAPDSLSSMDLRPPMAEQLRAYLSGADACPTYLGSIFTEGRR